MTVELVIIIAALLVLVVVISNIVRYDTASKVAPKVEVKPEVKEVAVAKEKKPRKRK